MSYDAKAYERARERFEAEKNERELTRSRKLAEIVSKIPEIAEIEERKKRLGISIVESVFTKNNMDVDLEEIKRASRNLIELRTKALVENGYRADTLDEKPLCGFCQDSGSGGGIPCDCFLQTYKEEQFKELARLFGVSSGYPHDFDATAYDAEPLKGLESKVNMREYMKGVFDAIKKYAHSFDKHSPNLLFTGASDDGKIYMLALIARVAIERGYSVTYLTAFTLAKALEDERFGRESVERDDLAGAYSNDLLLLDGLGGEQVSPYTSAAILDLVDRRISLLKPTVISAIMTINEIGEFYGLELKNRLQTKYVTHFIAPKKRR